VGPEKGTAGGFVHRRNQDESGLNAALPATSGWSTYRALLRDFSHGVSVYSTTGLGRRRLRGGAAPRHLLS